MRDGRGCREMITRVRSCAMIMWQCSGSGLTASRVPHSNPGHLVWPVDHPGRGVGGVAHLVEVIRGAHVDVRSVGVHLFADIVGRRTSAVRGNTVILVMLKNDLLFGGSDEVARRHWRHVISSDERPKSRKNRAGAGSSPELLRSPASRNRDRGCGLTICGMKVESAQGDALLQIEPQESAALQIWPALDPRSSRTVRRALAPVRTSP